MSDPKAAPELYELHDQQAEDAMLAAMLTNDEACALGLSRLCAEDFYMGSRSTVFRAMAKLHAAGGGVDVVTVRAALPDAEREHTGGFAFALAESHVVASHAADYCRTILNLSAKRRAMVASYQLQQVVRSANGDVGALAADFQRITAELVAEIRARNATDPGAPAASPFLDLAVLLGSEDEEQGEWLDPRIPILAKGRGHAVYAGAKSKKSLSMLSLAAKAAHERRCLTLYLDYEMTPADVRERLRDMGYGPESDLSWLKYALLPTLPPLDTEEGGLALLGLLDRAVLEAGAEGAHELVVIDTISRAVQGEENPADTWRAFYRNTGMRLKRRGATWARLDHTGKDEEKGQRGSKAKDDDVDVVWYLRQTQNGIVLERRHARMPWVPEKVTLLQEDFPLRFLPAADDWPVGTADVANILDRLGVPLQASVRAAGTELRKLGEGRRHDVVTAALKWRREKAADHFRPRGEHAGEHGERAPGTRRGTAGEQAAISLGNTPGNTGEQPPRQSGEQTPPLKRGSFPQPSDGGPRTSGTDDGFPF